MKRVLKYFCRKIKNKNSMHLFIKNNPTSDINPKSMVNSKTILRGFNVMNNCDIRYSDIGSCTVIGDGCKLINCSIGSFCSIAADVHIQKWSHPTNFVSTSATFYEAVNSYPFGIGPLKYQEELKCSNGRVVNIGNDVWIGEHVILKGGITIGDGAIIGMGAVVTKDVPPYAIVGGVPAKIIKFRFNDEEIQKLLAIKWWDWPLNTIKERKGDFGDLKHFLNKYYLHN